MGETLRRRRTAPVPSARLPPKRLRESSSTGRARADRRKLPVPSGPKFTKLTRNGVVVQMEAVIPVARRHCTTRSCVEMSVDPALGTLRKRMAAEDGNRGALQGRCDRQGEGPPAAAEDGEGGAALLPESNFA